jgi:hypothetical protein
VFHFLTDICRDLPRFGVIAKLCTQLVLLPVRSTFFIFLSSFGIGGQTVSFAGQIRIFSNFVCNR